MIAFALAAALNGPVKRSDGPVDQPRPSPTELLRARADARARFTSTLPARAYDGAPSTSATAAITSDDAFVFTDVTDDGFVYTRRNDLWFSDGETPVQIGSHVCGLPRNGIRHHRTRTR